MRSVIKKISAFVLAVTILISGIIPVNASEVDGTIDSDHGEAVFLESGNGSLYFNTTNGDVHVTDNGMTGYVWGDFVGWVSLDITGYGVLNNAEGDLSGYAWGENTGWVNFNPTNGGVTIDDNGVFHGYAWSQNHGWISFDDVRTDWRPLSLRLVEDPEDPKKPTTVIGPPPVVPPEPPVIPPPTVPPTTPPTTPPPPPTTPPTNPPPPPGKPEFPEVPPGGGIKGITIDTAVFNVSDALRVVGIISTLVTALATATLFSSAISFGELIFVPARIWSLISALFGLRKKVLPWGTVYDSVTKLPLDPAYVTLKDREGNEIASAITDLDGRFGFFVPKGTYYLSVVKNNYTFPSTRMLGRNNDVIYNDLYFGREIIIGTEGEVISNNIPMDPIAFDWNEFAKKDMKVMKFHSKSEVAWTTFSEWMYRVGFAIAIVFAAIYPNTYNYAILGIYCCLFTLRLIGMKPRKHGTVSEMFSGNPLSFAVVGVYSNALQSDLFKKVADQYGRYYALVPQGKYVVSVSKRDASDPEKYIETGSKKEYDASNGIINIDLKA